jgi:hypothetical protein
MDIKLTNNNLTQNKYLYNDNNIAFCSMTVINSVSTIEKIFSFFINNEHTISKNDSIILDFDSDIYELIETTETIKDLKFNYYDFGTFTHFPKSIVYNLSNYEFKNDFYLSYNEPFFDDDKKIYFQNFNIFKEYCNLHHINIIESRYNCTYHNIHTKELSFCICKLYECSNSSKLLIAYDKTLIDKTKIITIIKNIFIENQSQV